MNKGFRTLAQATCAASLGCALVFGTQIGSMQQPADLAHPQKLMTVQKAYANEIIAPVLSYYKDLIIVTDKPLKLRKSMSVNAGIIDSSPELVDGTFVHAEGISKDKKWIYVRYNQSPGWIPITNTEEVTTENKSMFTTAEVTLTAGPGKGDKRAVAPKDQELHIDGSYGQYVHTYFNAKDGWVKTDVLTAEQPKKEEKPAVEPTPAPAPAPTPAPQPEEKSFVESLASNTLVLVVGGLALILVIIGIAAGIIMGRQKR